MSAVVHLARGGWILRGLLTMGCGYVPTCVSVGETMTWRLEGFLVTSPRWLLRPSTRVASAILLHRSMGLDPCSFCPTIDGCC
jgi:hypothetical protein